ncbi:Hypothetical protein R9X50_00036600 [Acrodontium crateriforme]|uniref:Septin-type G domain-containing protein n=1 Tax=Acrodontium crateriforme TaxID=150365 RepID=A0AAQ3LX57_9PEZI|nr:Hypothetical protein R9X50_00036600 [Acrodontium crateriforme]
MSTIEDTAKKLGLAISTGGPTMTPSVASTSPTTFFLKSDKDMEANVSRGRKGSRTSNTAPRMLWTAHRAQEAESPIDMGARDESSFGVESLEDTLSSTFGLSDTHQRRQSGTTDGSAEGGAETDSPSGVALPKKRTGNPVHPKILATGQRILSSDHERSYTVSSGSTRSSRSPTEVLQRRGSTPSVINFTPAGMSPRLELGMVGTPRSGSPKSVRLSDEENGSVADDASSQAVLSSNGDDENEQSVNGENDKRSSMPQLVMPSISMPSRRPFTERGKRMGRLKVMVVGPDGVGKTTLIQNIFRCCEDIMHVDPTSDNRTFFNNDTDSHGKPLFSEHFAATRPYPSWWTDFETRRMLHRRKSLGDGVLERNICFIDSPGMNQDSHVRSIQKMTDKLMRRTANLGAMSDNDLVSVLSGDGGTSLDAILWLFDPDTICGAEQPGQILDETHKNLLLALSQCTNIIPLIGRADKFQVEDIEAQKAKVQAMFNLYDIEPLSLHDKMTFSQTASGNSGNTPREPFSISSALSDDAETIDASVLMSSQYIQPLIPSDLAFFVDRFFEPENISRMRHIAATKFVLWRHTHLGSQVNFAKLLQTTADCSGGSPIHTAAESVDDEHQSSKVLVPRVTSSIFQSNRSLSPGGSEVSVFSAPNTATGQSGNALSNYNLHNDNNLAYGDERPPFREIRLAKWAQDLQRGLSNERRRYREMYTQLPSDWISDDGRNDSNEKAMISSRPARGRLGGDLAVIDPRDPLGVLALSQTITKTGWIAIRVAGSCGLVAAVAFWVLRNWGELQSTLFGSGRDGLIVVQTQALGPPTPSRGWIDFLGLRDFFGW